MLEKIAGVAVLTKLRAILLMEADFNCHNRLIFGNRMMKLAQEHGLVPEEIYNEKGKTQEDAIVCNRYWFTTSPDSFAGR